MSWQQHVLDSTLHYTQQTMMLCMKIDRIGVYTTMSRAYKDDDGYHQSATQNRPLQNV